MVRTATLATIWFVTSQAAGAQVILWRNLQSGDTPQQTEAKLRAMPEIKAVKSKVRGDVVREQDINMVDGGVPIFEGHFSVATSYAGLSLERVQLTSKSGCANTAHEFVSKIADELRHKYPTELAALKDKYYFSSSALDATSTTPTTTSSAYSNGSTTVLLTTIFERLEPPQYVSGALGRALYQIARSSYDSQANSCAGTGVRTARVAITYLPQKVWDDGFAAEQANTAKAKETARDNL